MAKVFDNDSDNETVNFNEIDFSPREGLVIKFKRLDKNAITPTKGTTYAAAWDLYALNDGIVVAGSIALIKTGIAMIIPNGWRGQIRSRSSLAKKHHLVTQGGVIDSDYRGDVGILISNLSKTDYKYKAGHRMAQMTIDRVPMVCLIEVEKLDETERGVGGYGSTGK